MITNTVEKQGLPQGIDDSLFKISLTPEEITAELKNLETYTREEIKGLANKLGIDFAKNTSSDKLKEDIASALQVMSASNVMLENISKTKNTEELKEVLHTEMEELFKDKTPELDPSEELKKHTFIQNMLRKLVRVRIIVKDPNLIHRKGGTYTFGNDKIKPISYYIPYVEKFLEKGYHVPLAILYVLSKKTYIRREYTLEQKAEKGSKVGYVNQGEYPSFEITPLQPLTKEELKELAKKQEILLKA